MSERGFTVDLLKNVKFKDRLIVSMTKLLVKLFLLINENDSQSQYIEFSFHRNKQSNQVAPDIFAGKYKLNIYEKTKACLLSLMNS